MRFTFDGGTLRHGSEMGARANLTRSLSASCSLWVGLLPVAIRARFDDSINIQKAAEAAPLSHFAYYLFGVFRHVCLGLKRLICREAP